MLTSTALTILCISQTDSRDPRLLKKAYHAALLRSHPDKVTTHGYATIDDVRAAYLILLSPGSDERQGYAVIDLDEFTYFQATQTWSHACRCGHGYSITEDDLDQGRDVVGCDGCSLFIRVTYEEVTDDS